MSLAPSIGAGTLVGGLLAAAVYLSLAPDPAPAATSVTPAASFAPVPTPTVTEEASDCRAPAELEAGECVLRVPGPTVVAAAPDPSPRATDHEREDGEDDHGREHEGGEDDHGGEHEDDHHAEHDDD